MVHAAVELAVAADDDRVDDTTAVLEAIADEDETKAEDEVKATADDEVGTTEEDDDVELGKDDDVEVADDEEMLYTSIAQKPPQSEPSREANENRSSHQTALDQPLFR